MLQPQYSLRAEPSDPTPLLFALEDIPSPALQRSGSFAAANTGSAGPGAQTKSTIETLQLLLGPASKAEEMVSRCWVLLLASFSPSMLLCGRTGRVVACFVSHG